MNKKQLIFMWFGIAATILFAFVTIVNSYRPDYANFSVEVFLVVLVTSGLIYTFRDKKRQEGKKTGTINLRRGFRRITHVLAGVAVIFGVVIAVGTVVDKYNSEQDNLRFKKIRALDFSDLGVQKQKGMFYDLVHSNTPKLTLEQMAATPKSEVSGRPNRLAGLLEQTKAEAELKKLEDSFWVTLSKQGLVGLCILAGSGGAATGYSGVWLVYLLIWRVYHFIRWLAMGFYDVNQEG